MEKIIFLHHSTGECIWVGKTNHYVYRLTKIGDVQKHFKKLNKINKTRYSLSEKSFPAAEGSRNYPFDYYDIWVKHAGAKPYNNELTLEILTGDYDVVIFKHCYPVSNILEDTGNPEIDSPEKRLENYKMQYNALKQKMHEFPDKKFIIWTPAVQVKSRLSEEEAIRTREFYNWVMQEWNEKGDNIYVWDFYQYETEGGLYFKDEYSGGKDESHPGVNFSARVAPMFARFIYDVVSGTTDR